MDSQRSEHPLRQYRQANDLSLEAFGVLVGAKKAVVCKWEGGVPPSPFSAIRIEEVTHGVVPRHVLRPDLWDAPGAPAPSESERATG
jgi:hypothetical protein